MFIDLLFIKRVNMRQSECMCSSLGQLSQQLKSDLQPLLHGSLPIWYMPVQILGPITSMRGKTPSIYRHRDGNHTIPCRRMNHSCLRDLKATYKAFSQTFQSNLNTITRQMTNAKQCVILPIQRRKAQPWGWHA